MTELTTEQRLTTLEENQLRMHENNVKELEELKRLMKVNIEATKEWVEIVTISRNLIKIIKIIAIILKYILWVLAPLVFIYLLLKGKFSGIPFSTLDG